MSVASENKKRLYSVIDSFTSEQDTTQQEAGNYVDCERISKFLSKILMVAIKDDCGQWVENTNSMCFAHLSEAGCPSLSQSVVSYTGASVQF